MERSQAQCFGATRGEIETRADVNYSRLLPLVRERLVNAAYPAVALGTELTLIQYGSSTLASTEPVGVPIIRMNNLQQDGWALQDLKYVTLPEKEVASYRVEPGDILFNRTNSKELVGKCEVFGEAGEWVFASYLIRVRTNPLTLDPQFASDFLNASTGRLQIDCVSRQIVGMTNINSEEIKDFGIPLPPLLIQRELVAAMNAARTLRQQQLAEAEALLAGFDEFVMTTVGLSVVGAKERPTFAIRQQDIGSRLDAFFHSPHFVPITQALAGTKTAMIGEIAQFSREVWRPETHAEPLFRYVEISGVNPRSGEATWQQTPTAEAPSRARMAIKPGDILVSLTRPHHGSIALLPAGFPESVASTGFAVLRNFSPLVVPSYVWAALRTKLGLQQMMQRSSGGNYPAITEAELAKVQIPVPDLATQQAIAEEVQRRRTAARTLREAAETGWAAAKAAFEARLLGTK